MFRSIKILLKVFRAPVNNLVLITSLVQILVPNLYKNLVLHNNSDISHLLENAFKAVLLFILKVFVL